MDAKQIERRIKDEFRKHKTLDWAKIAAIKIASELEVIKGSMILVTNYNSKKNKVKTTYDEKYQMWRVEVK